MYLSYSQQNTRTKHQWKYFQYFGLLPISFVFFMTYDYVLL